VNRPLLLSGLSHEQQRDLLAAARPRQLKPRDVLGHQGEPADLFALVQIGHLKLAQVNAAGAESLVRFVGPGDCYGAIALVAGSRYPVAAIAVEPTRALTWSRAEITDFAERLPRLKSNILEEITRRMTGVLSMAQELATERVPQRLAKALLRLAEHGGDRTRDGVHIVHPVTRQELADLTGTTLFTVSRLMSQWESDGLLLSGRGDVTIVDPQGLEAAASTDSD
jgi:CRP/FNR family transcriptional regulator, nitrogen oxide reductase regulator